MAMPFGAHKGLTLDQLPDHYVTWLTHQPWLRDPLASAVRAEATRRRRALTLMVLAHPDPALGAEPIAAGSRALASRYRDDAAAQARVEATADWLSARLRELPR